MKAKMSARIACLAGMWFSFTTLSAVNVTVTDSIVSLATNHTKYYTFHDPASGESLIVRMSATPIATGAYEPFSLRGGGTRIAIGSTAADGNSIDSTEAVEFQAALVYASPGVLAGTVKFHLSSLGMIGSTAPSPAVVWTSSADTTPAFPVYAEEPYPLDAPAAMASLEAANYLGRLSHNGMAGPGTYLLSDGGPSIAGDGIVMAVEFSTVTVPPQASSWLTTYAGQYARIYRNESARSNGVAVTTWTNTSNLVQTLPAYCGVQEISSSANWVYVRSTGLGNYVMGPWTNPPKPFPNLPVNQKLLWRFPRAPVVPLTKTNSIASTIGYFVDGISMFNSWSGYFWGRDGKNMTNRQGLVAGGFWNADAYFTESITFDTGLAHPESKGRQHYHANPIALRYFLGDHVDYNSTNKNYTESTAPVTRHSPILGWVQDGFPVYGPYGYSDPTNPASGVRRMTSGYALRDGSHGTVNLASTGRTTRPLWAERVLTPDTSDPMVLPTTAAMDSRIGPNVSAHYPLGYYMEDYDYLGDHLYTPGKDFDLDEFNGRWCVTPEFPVGTYAYFVALTDTNTPAFPYNIGRGYCGDPQGGQWTNITETVTTHFIGEINVPLILNPPVTNGGNVVLTWSAAEGGHYRVESTTNFITWTTLTTNAPATEIVGSYTHVASAPFEAYRVARWTFDGFDPVLDVIAPGGSVDRGTIVIVTLQFPAAPVSPGTMPTLARLGSNIFATNLSYDGDKTMRATFSIPPDAIPGTTDILVEFDDLTVMNLAGYLTIQ
jgi:hypothetical protein